jgi:hypothetical protein
MQNDDGLWLLKRNKMTLLFEKVSHNSDCNNFSDIDKADRFIITYFGNE